MSESTQVSTTTNSTTSFRFLDLPKDIRRIVYDFLPEPVFRDSLSPSCCIAYTDYTRSVNMLLTNRLIYSEARPCLKIYRTRALARQDLIIITKSYSGEQMARQTLFATLLDILAAEHSPNPTTYPEAMAALDGPIPRSLMPSLLNQLSRLHEEIGVEVGHAALAEALSTPLSTMLLQLHQRNKMQIRWYLSRRVQQEASTWGSVYFLMGYVNDTYPLIDFQLVLVCEDTEMRDKMRRSWSNIPHQDKLWYEVASAEEAASMFG